MIGRGRAAGQHELNERHPDREAQRLGGHAAPHPLHRHEPGNELLAEPRGVGARQRLVEMMMRIDEPRQDDMARGVERRLRGEGWRLAARNAFNNLSALDHNSALGIGCEDGERVLDPQTHAIARSLLQSRAHRRGGPKGKAFGACLAFPAWRMNQLGWRAKNVFDG